MSKYRTHFNDAVDLVDCDILQAQFQFTMNSQPVLNSDQDFSPKGEAYQVFRLVVRLEELYWHLKFLDINDSSRTVGLSRLICRRFLMCFIQTRFSIRVHVDSMEILKLFVLLSDDRSCTSYFLLIWRIIAVWWFLETFFAKAVNDFIGVIFALLLTASSVSSDIVAMDIVGTDIRAVLGTDKLNRK